MSVRPKFSATFSVVPYCGTVPLANEGAVELKDESDNEDSPDAIQFSRARSETLTSTEETISHLASPPSIDDEAETERAASVITPPSSDELMERLKEARETGKTMHELVHELQNEFYPLLPPPGYVIPAPTLYSATVAKLEWLERRAGPLYSLKKPEDDSDYAIIFPTKSKGSKLAEPAYSRKRRTIPQRWASSLWDYLELPVSLCSGKRRKREPDLDEAEEDKWIWRNEHEIKAGRTDDRSRKRRRVV
ncbi:hypothetical protein J3R30DRAFT_118226 [Lentinula aciculospora]|uniref:Uncharacterized protein n=1 Tax=Lentinula aciculospora TaxID=153920 RepID=A0A9W9AU68_9AGAR|nr:hypothetical protein J3R30DRAFT_118226 [Lentinula aciculospora]